MIALLLPWLGSIPFTLLGLGNGYRLTAQATGVMNMVCNLTLAVVGGLWFPLSLFPSSAPVPVRLHAHEPVRAARHVGRRRTRARPRGGAGADRMAAGLRLVRCGLVPAGPHGPSERGLRTCRGCAGSAVRCPRGRSHGRSGRPTGTRSWSTRRPYGRPENSPEHLGPPPSGFALLPWLLMGMGAFSNLFQGKTPNPWIGGIGLLVFNSLYIHVVFRAFTKEAREARSTRGALIALGIVTCLLGGLYGGSWLLFFPLLGLAAGAIVRDDKLAGQASNS